MAKQKEEMIAELNEMIAHVSAKPKLSTLDVFIVKHWNQEINLLIKGNRHK